MYTDQILVFPLDGDYYGVAFDQVIEVIKLRDLTRLPGVPPFICGVTHLRGEILVVTDIRYLMGIPHNKSLGDDLYVVVTEVPGFWVGFLCEKDYKVFEVRSEDIRPPLAILPRRMLRFVRGHVQHGEKVFPWVDIKSLFECEDVQRLKKGEVHDL